MKLTNLFKFAAVTLFTAAFSIGAFAQKRMPSKPLVKQTTFKSDKIDFGAGGTITITGAPNGSIQIEGWNKNEVEINAEIIVEAASEKDANIVAAVCGFAIEDSLSQLRITSVGTHDKKYLKKVVKKFPKRLRNAPFRINYKIKVPIFSDLLIDGGKGDLNLSKVEGTIRINYLESNAKLNLIGGTVQATFGNGNVDVTIATRSWRGRFAEIQVARGKLNVWLPQNLHANFTAKVLRDGKISNSYKMLKPKRRTKFTDKDVTGKAGSGGADLSFTIGDGLLNIGNLKPQAK